MERDHARPAGPGGPLTGATDWVNAVAFSPDGRSLAAGSSDGRVLVWDLDTRALTAELPQPQPVTSLAWDSGGRRSPGMPMAGSGRGSCPPRCCARAAR